MTYSCATQQAYSFPALFMYGSSTYCVAKDELEPWCTDWTSEVTDRRQGLTSSSIASLGEAQDFFSDLRKLSFGRLNGYRPIALVWPPRNISLHLGCPSLHECKILAHLAWLIQVVNVENQLETTLSTYAVFLVTLVLESWPLPEPTGSHDLVVETHSRSN